MYVYPYSFSKWDEYHIHQTPDVLSVPLSTNPGFVDHCCMWVNPKGGPGPMVYMSFYTFPNTRVRTTAAAVNYGGKQYQIRASQQYSGDPEILKIGPVEQTIDEPLVQRTMRLEENPHIPVSFELVARAAYPIADMGIDHGLEGERTNVGLHWYSQLMTFSGQIKIEGETFDADGYVGQRDRGWGVPGAGRPEDKSGFGFWLYLHFEDFGVELYYGEREDTTPVTVFGGFIYKDGRRKIARYINHNVEFEQGTRLWKKYQVIVEMENGDRHTLNFKMMGEWNSYVGWGMQPVRDESGKIIAQGRGGMSAFARLATTEPHIESDILDRTDPEFLVNIAARAAREIPVEVECDGKIGYGVLEDSVGRRSQYGFML